MKKQLVFLLTLTLTVTFCFSRQFYRETKKKSLLAKPEKTIQTITPENAQKKREHYLKLKKQMQEWSAKFPSISQRQSIDSSSALDIDIQLLEDSVNLQTDNSGNVYMTGLCTNTGSDQAFFIFVDVEFYGEGYTSLGYEIGMAIGGRNVQVPDEDATLCLPTLVDGDEGFFQVWPDDILYSDVEWYSVTFYWGYSEIGNLPLANARLSFDGDFIYDKWDDSKLKITGTVKNTSSTHGAAYTAAFLAVFNDTNTKVIDMNANFVGGTSSAGYNWAVYPSKTETVDIFFDFAQYGQIGSAYRSCFMYYEGELDLAADAKPPIGSFDTPINGSTVYGSIAVTGWALDDIGLESVKIYRQEGGGRVYLGDANFLEGARPDVENNPLFESYPNKSKAGWGYMLLTNFLPNGGNGTFVLYAIATDLTGKTTSLPIPKTIICDNANAVKPFGAIDTPGQGGTAYGSNYINWGWALTPQPDSIPFDGSTINVWIDGVNVGHPKYNNYRADIAALFPGYANSNGAAGYFIFDTTLYENAVHTIQWTVTDTPGGDTDGIGSRYFNITNGGVSDYSSISTVQSQTLAHTSQDIAGIPVNHHDPIKMKKGFGKNKASIIPPSEDGVAYIEINELERVEVTLSTNHPIIAGYHVVGHQLRRLPTGSTLNKEKGLFCWQPGPGYFGQYQMVFIEKKPNHETSRKNINIKIVPQSKDWN